MGERCIFVDRRSHPKDKANSLDLSDHSDNVIRAFRLGMQAVKENRSDGIHTPTSSEEIQATKQ